MHIENQQKTRLNCLLIYFAVLLINRNIFFSEGTDVIVRPNNENKPSNRTSKNNSKVLVITGERINSDFFQEFSKKHQNVQVIIFDNCVIEYNLDLIGYTFILRNNSNISDKHIKNSKFIEIKKNEIIFSNQGLDMNYDEVFEILSKDNTPINKIRLSRLLFNSPDQIEELFTQLTKLHSKKKFKTLVIENISVGVEEHRKFSIDQIKDFIGKTNVNLEEVNDAVTGPDHYDIDPKPEMAGTSDSRSDNKFKFSKKSLQKELQKRDFILDVNLKNRILESYDYVQTHANDQDQQTKSLVKYYKDRVSLVLQLPTREKAFRKFKNTEYLKKIINAVFLRRFPAGAGHIYQKIEDALVTFYKTGNMKDLQNILLVGAPGTGKTSWAQLIAMIFALFASDEKEISDDLLDKVTNNNEAALEELYKTLETKSFSHLCVIKGSTLVDINVLVGVSRSYTSPSAGLILKVLLNKIYPVLFFLDEIDKAENFHNSSGSKRANAIHFALLNFLDRNSTGGEDTWLEGSMHIENLCWVIMTANGLDNISDVLKDRFHIMQVEGPTASEKLVIVLMELLSTLKAHLLIDSVKNYSVERNGSEVYYKIGGTKDDKITLVISEKVFKSIVKTTQGSEGVRAILRYLQSIWKKLYLQVMEDGEKKGSKMYYLINMDNIDQYVELEHCIEEVVQGPNILCVYEATDGNHKCGSIYVLPSKTSRSSEPVTIIGGGRGNGQNYHLLRDLATIIVGILSNLPTIVSPEVSGKFGLSLIKIEATNVILTIPTDGVEAAYTNNLILSIVVAIISSLRKIPLKKKVIILGDLTPHGQLLMGGTKYRSVVTAITNRPEDCNIVVVPSSLKNSKSAQQYFAKLPSTVSIIYASNLSEVLQAVLDVNYV